MAWQACGTVYGLCMWGETGPWGEGCSGRTSPASYVFGATRDARLRGWRMGGRVRGKDQVKKRTNGSVFVSEALFNDACAVSSVR